MFPERIHNLYFTYLFLMRAIGKAGDELLEYDYSTGKRGLGYRVRGQGAVMLSWTSVGAAVWCRTACPL